MSESKLNNRTTHAGTFAEYLRFIGREDELIRELGDPAGAAFVARDVHTLNTEFVNYLTG